MVGRLSLDLREDGLRDHCSGAGDLAGVSHCLAAVEDGRVQHIGYIIDHCRPSTNRWDECFNLRGKRAVVLDEWRGEQ